ncbi:MAG: multiheme c-type cytochrome [Myxococcota bacterium]|nr:multiheme c-type cytochrome [Myxococcota bacterium]
MSLETSPEAAGAAESERERILGPFLYAHWDFPVPPQGEPPEGFSDLEASIQPAACAGCHPKQFSEWSTSLHAGAFSPGFAGQLIEGGLARAPALRQCQTCHAPLAEQQPVLHSGEPSRHFDASLRQQGLVCAVCHVRAHQRFGPPRREGVPPPPEPVPHGGFEVRPEYQESRFCSPCHQFFDDEGPNGKSVENTYKEWEASPHAAEGKTCQSCHMPDRAHLWRGIHDPDTVRDAVDIRFEPIGSQDGDRVHARLTLESREIGHMFPTYVTPRVLMEIWQEDAGGTPLEDTRVRHEISRKIDFGTQTEIHDTRVPPHGEAVLELEQARAPGAVRLRAAVVVEPDFFYRGVFERYLPGLEDARARKLIAEALRRASESPFEIGRWEIALPESG